MECFGQLIPHEHVDYHAAKTLVQTCMQQKSSRFPSRSLPPPRLSPGHKKKALNDEEPEDHPAHGDNNTNDVAAHAHADDHDQEKSDCHGCSDDAHDHQNHEHVPEKKGCGDDACQNTACCPPGDQNHDHAHNSGSGAANSRPAETFGIGSFTFRARRPFHPERLMGFVMGHMPSVLRSKVGGAAGVVELDRMCVPLFLMQNKEVVRKRMCVGWSEHKSNILYLCFTHAICYVSPIHGSFSRLECTVLHQHGHGMCVQTGTCIAASV